MNGKKIISLLLAGVLCCSALTACTKKAQPVATTTKVQVATDADDNVKSKVDANEKGTLEIKDADGNTLTIVPVYNSDGKTIIAGYVEGVKDKNGKALDEKTYGYYKAVIALELDAEGNASIKQGTDKKPITLEALSDDKGYIIALKDTIDVDNDKDTQEYFKVVSKLDNNKNMFIKLDKDDKGKLINVTVSNDNGKTTVTDEKGNKKAATESTKAANISQIVVNKNQSTTKTTTKKPSSDTPAKKPSGNTGGSTNDQNSKPKLDYIPIVLQNNGKVACDASNVTVNEASAVNGGTEIVVNGAGEFSKYYVTSETGVFSGQLEFRFTVDEDVEVKFYNVSISTSKKTAVKFTNVDSENEKENDSEEAGDGTGQSGTSAITPAPQVELSLTGSNSFKATGSGKNGTIYSECKLAIKGHGTAEIDGGPNLSGICSTESVEIKNATLNITSNAKQGISCDKKVTVKGGANIDILSKGDGIHCNKFETEALVNGEADSKIKIRSVSVDSADGIDSNDQIIINSGNIDVVTQTAGKYALKVRKVIKAKPTGIFQINGGTVVAVGNMNVIPTDDSKQKVVYAKARQATKITVGKITTSADGTCFIISPANSDTATNTQGTSKPIKFNDSNICTVSF